MSKRSDVIEAARALVNTPTVVETAIVVSGVKSYVLEAAAVQRLSAALVAFDAYRAAELKAGGINPDGSSIHPSGRIG